MAYGRLTILTPPTGYPVTVDLVKQHTRIDNAEDDDVLLPLYISSATSMCEAFLNRALLSQSLQWTVADSFPPNSWPLIPAPVLILPLNQAYNFSYIQHRDYELPRSPVTAVTEVSYQHWEDADPTIMDPEDYSVSLDCDPARVRFHNDIAWGQMRFVAFKYTAGYGTPDDIPMPIIHAILAAVAWFYEHRADQEVGDLPLFVQALLWPYRLVSFA
jgi:hypothetical protein